MHRHILALFAAGILLLTTTNYCAGKSAVSLLNALIIFRGYYWRVNDLSEQSVPRLKRLTVPVI